MEPRNERKLRSAWQRLRLRFKAWGRRVPRGLRSLVGVLLLIGGLFGFLPIVGFWMIPLGGFLIALDLAALRRAMRRPDNAPGKGAKGRADD